LSHLQSPGVLTTKEEEDEEEEEEEEGFLTKTIR
jgi:hypothetical protein